MLKLERTFRLFIVAATIGFAVFVPSRPAFAYTMEDYYNALAALEYDASVINELGSQIMMLQESMDSTNLYYGDLVRECGISHGMFPKPEWQVQECRDSVYQEWYLWIWPMEMEMNGLQSSMSYAQVQWSNDEQLLGLIKAELGIP